MRQRTRKLIGTVLMIILLVVYSLVAMVIGAQIVPHAGPWTELAFYFFAGMGWIIPGGLLIMWMQRPDPDVAE